MALGKRRAPQLKSIRGKASRSKQNAASRRAAIKVGNRPSGRDAKHVQRGFPGTGLKRGRSSRQKMKK